MARFNLTTHGDLYGDQDARFSQMGGVEALEILRKLKSIFNSEQTNILMGQSGWEDSRSDAGSIMGEPPLSFQSDITGSRGFQTLGKGPGNFLAQFKGSPPDQWQLDGSQWAKGGCKGPDKGAGPLLTNWSPGNHIPNLAGRGPFHPQMYDMNNPTPTARSKQMYQGRSQTTGTPRTINQPATRMGTEPHHPPAAPQERRHKGLHPKAYNQLPIVSSLTPNQPGVVYKHMMAEALGELHKNASSVTKEGQLLITPRELPYYTAMRIMACAFEGYDTDKTGQEVLRANTRSCYVYQVGSRCDDKGQAIDTPPPLPDLSKCENLLISDRSALRGAAVPGHYLFSHLGPFVHPR